MLVLNEAEVRQAVDMAGAIGAIEDGLRQQAAGRATVGERQNLRWGGGWIRTMSCALLDGNVIGYKEFHLAGTGVRYACHLFDATSGLSLAQMDANFLTQIRTGAAGGVALRHLAPPGPVHVAVIGAGAEARSQLEALAAVREIAGVRVHSPRAERRERFAAEMSGQLDIPVEASSTPESAVGDADVVLVATNTGMSGATAYRAAWIQPGQHLNSIGSTMPEQRELEHDVWSAVDRVILDTPGLLHESGDAIAASREGTLDQARVGTLADLAAGVVPGRAAGSREVTLYKSVGTALQDVAVAAAAYRRASELGLGIEVSDYQTVKEFQP